MGLADDAARGAAGGDAEAARRESTQDVSEEGVSVPSSASHLATPLEETAALLPACRQAPSEVDGEAGGVHESPSLAMWASALPIGVFGHILVGYSVSYTSPTFSSSANASNPAALDVAFGMGDEERTWFASTYILSASVGALLAGMPVDWFGKRKALIVGYTCFAVGYIILATAQPPPAWATGNSSAMAILYLARAVMGFGDASVAVASTVYLTEIATVEHRGMLGASSGFAVSVGVMGVFGLGLCFHWRALAWIGAGFGVAGLCLTLAVPESPQWLVLQGRHAEAERSLQTLRSRETDVQALMARFKRRAAEDAHRASRRPGVWRQLRALGAPPRLRALALAMVLSLILTFSGQAAVAVYSGEILGVVYSDGPANRIPFYGRVAQLPISLAIFKVTHVVPRKPLLLTSMALYAVGLGLMIARLLGYGPDALMAIGYVAVVTMWCLGMGPLPTTLVAEITHPSVRATVAALCYATCSVANFFSIKMFMSLRAAFGGGAVGLGRTFLGPLVCVVAVMGIIAAHVPETHRKTYDDIERELRRGRQDAHPECAV
eukprot:TRINITY_DN8832_c0_g1_i1.p1 TRINITY_DN8832_c0_g1~~TRINITY_DN8832_c0_g1_i1.p1  ORF type:complete len:552 (+),score=136.87 TRINITY_DN8832_c0_g1_i1:134-1789(+)